MGFINYKQYYFWLGALIVSSLMVIWYIYNIIIKENIIFNSICGIIFLGLMIFNYSKIKPLKKKLDDDIKKEVIKALK